MAERQSRKACAGMTIGVALIVVFFKDISFCLSSGKAKKFLNILLILSDKCFKLFLTAFSLIGYGKRDTLFRRDKACLVSTLRGTHKTLSSYESF